MKLLELIFKFTHSFHDALDDAAYKSHESESDSNAKEDRSTLLHISKINTS